MFVLALVEVKLEMRAEVELFAFLNDMYILSFLHNRLENNCSRSRFSEGSRKNAGCRKPSTGYLISVRLASFATFRSSVPQLSAHNASGQFVVLCGRARRRNVKNYGYSVGRPSRNRKGAPGREDVGNFANAVGSVGFAFNTTNGPRNLLSFMG